MNDVLIRIVAAPVATFVGAWLALLTLILHQIPWALILCLVVTVGFIVRGFTSRLNLWLFTLAWCAVIAWSLRAEPGGDIVLQADLPGYTLLGSALLMPFLALFLTLMGRQRT